MYWFSSSFSVIFVRQCTTPVTLSEPPSVPGAAKRSRPFLSIELFFAGTVLFVNAVCAVGDSTNGAEISPSVSVRPNLLLREFPSSFRRSCFFGLSFALGHASLRRYSCAGSARDGFHDGIGRSRHGPSYVKLSTWRAERSPPRGESCFPHVERSKKQDSSCAPIL